MYAGVSLHDPLTLSPTLCHKELYIAPKAIFPLVSRPLDVQLPLSELACPCPPHSVGWLCKAGLKCHLFQESSLTFFPLLERESSYSDSEHFVILAFLIVCITKHFL